MIDGARLVSRSGSPSQNEYFLKEGTLRRLSLTTLVSVIVGLCAGSGVGRSWVEPCTSQR